MGKWKIWIGLFALFFSGILCGSVGTRIYVQQQIMHAVEGKRPVLRNLLFDSLSQDLDLNSQQEREIEKIIDRLEAQLHELRGRHFGEVKDIIQQATADMEEHLSTEQGLELNASIEKFKARRDRFRSKRRPGDRPPKP